MINTYNESDLHKTLKIYYSQIYDGLTEQKIDKYICDIYSNKHGIIEIQIGNFKALKQKCKFAIKNKINFTIVHPIITEKKIENYSQNQVLVSKRKSPKKENLYSKLKSITGIAELLPNKYVKIIFVNVAITERKIWTSEKVQLKNKSRRFLKEWYKDGKELTQIFDEKEFRTRKDFLSLLPKFNTSIKEFSSKEIKEEFQKINDKNLSKSAVQNANLLLWILHKMNLIQRIPKDSRLFYYKISER